MTLVDTNIILDIFECDPQWFTWSSVKLSEAAGDNAATINPIIIAELSRDFGDLPMLRLMLGQVGLEVLPLDERSGFTAGKRFHQFRRTRGADENARVLPDFLIGAHALTLGVPLLTRDPRLYRRYFPDLALITPETHP